MIVRSGVGLTRRQIAWRCAQELREGDVVNVGIGLPGLVPQYVPADREVIFQSENGIVGVGPPPQAGQIDPDLIDATKDPVTLVRGGSFVHHTDAFVMIRGGHIDVALLGAFQVSEQGDLANWRTNADERSPAVGGAMDLAAGAREIRVLMNHTTNNGAARILRACTYPLTARNVVKRIYTSLAEFTIDASGLLLTGLLDGLSVDDLRTVTDAPFQVAVNCEAIEMPDIPDNVPSIGGSTQ